MSNEKLLKRALTHLVPDEEAAVTLKNVHKKSTWQAGEVLGKAHYKYLEIVGRGEQFLRMFSKHYSMFKNFFPDEVTINPSVKEYLQLVLLERRNPRRIRLLLSSMQFRDKKFRDTTLTIQIRKWQNSKSPIENYFAEMILEFDRWNNWRILPETLQLPHAFKRRQKNVHKKKLLYSIRLEESKIKDLKKYFKLKKSEDISKAAWVYLFKNVVTQEYEIIPVVVTPDSKKVFSMLFLPMYESQKACEKAVFLILNYVLQTNPKDRVKSGLAFWPTFRDYQKDTYNEADILNLSPDIKDNPKYQTNSQSSLKTARKNLKKYLNKDPEQLKKEALEILS